MSNDSRNKGPISASGKLGILFEDLTQEYGLLLARNNVLSAENEGANLRIAELDTENRGLREALKDEVRDEMKAKLDARCNHSELLHEITELSRHNTVLQKADMHREKIWKKRVAELEAQAELDKAEINAAFNNAEMFADRIAALEAENNELQAWVDSYREHGTRVLNANKEEIDTLKAKLNAAHNWVLNTCPEEYNQFVKALGEAK